MTGYTDIILKYVADNSHAGVLENPDGTGEVGLSREEIGSRLAVRFNLKLAGPVAERIGFQAFGCGFTIAACAAAAELARLRTLDQIQAVSAARIDRQLGGLPEERAYCAELACRALQAAATSACRGGRPVRAELDPAQQDEQEHNPQPTAQTPLYRTLLASAGGAGVAEEDRRLFACLLTAAGREACPTAAALGLEGAALAALLETCFPGFDPALLEAAPPDGPAEPPAINPDVRDLLLTNVPQQVAPFERDMATWLARMIAARAARPGHLWVAMGLFERAQLGAAIQRHLPGLAAANARGMRWKRFFFKQVCELNGGTLCKSPDCGDCSDYALCFAPEDC